MARRLTILLALLPFATLARTVTTLDGGWTADGVAVDVPHLYIECDGLPVNPNWYEYWVSCRIDGEGAFYVDRLAMRRVPPPKK